MRARSRPNPTGTRSDEGARGQLAGAGLIRPRTISGQLARILAVSLVLVLALLGLTMSTQVSAYRRSGETVDAVAVALAAQDLVQQVQRERGLSNGLLGGDQRLRQPVTDQHAGTDSALRALVDTVAEDPPGAGEVRSALGHLSGLPAIRSQVDNRNVTRQAAFQFYTDGIDALNRLSLGLDQARDPAVRHGLQALYALGDAKEFAARERGFLNGVFASGEFAPGEYVQFLDIRAARNAALTAFGHDATPAQQARLDAVLASENATRATESENIAIASTLGPLVEPVDPAVWWAQMTAVIDEQRTVQQVIGDDVGARAEKLRRDAALILAGFALAALLAIAAEVALVFASIRAIVRPLARLATEADDVASTRLPEVIAAWHSAADAKPDPPAPVRTPPGASIEIAAVAGALDRVQTTAFDLASEQALVRRNTTESMANLARRNQNLVRRQLGLISEFEREELDPKALSNLFELDHLATRMRRNAESLLVLVGEASPRRWAEPIALTDVIRAGLSEVDDYRRVVLRRVDDIAVTGAVVSELAHILAELIENGLAFSPPDLEVEVYGRKVASGYLLAVVDHGVGMPAEQLAEANARLRGEQDFIVASTRYLGHYVVGRLAGRLGIDVELNTSPVSGIVARLLLPPALLADEKSSQTADSRGGGAVRSGNGAGAEVDATGSNAADTHSAVLSPNGNAMPGNNVAANSERGGRAAGGLSHSLPGAGTPWPTDTNGRSRHSRPTESDAGRFANANGHANGSDGGNVNGSGGANGHGNGSANGHGGGSADVNAHAPDNLRSGDSAYAQFLSSTADSAKLPPAVSHNGAPTGDRYVIPSPTELTGVRNGASAPHPRDLPTVESIGIPAVERTRNGLVKRSKRAKITGAPERPRRDPHQDRPPVVERTPDQTRSMLSSFRTGHERGGDNESSDRTRPQEPR
ncbi:nitrate- and nitrite sensing domain-containing protein [Nocardia sp. NPDC058658]|uniref:nitrate- and nitrite sensing domain-containing protein n=1 Tax=Nocardia sp. NPDC058658 TaxID=3346580 RepID=UPI003647588F